MSSRKIVYRKLNVSSHAELYNLFFRAPEFAESAGERDPLELLRQSEREATERG